MVDKEVSTWPLAFPPGIDFQEPTEGMQDRHVLKGGGVWCWLFFGSKWGLHFDHVNNLIVTTRVETCRGSQNKGVACTTFPDRATAMVPFSHDSYVPEVKTLARRTGKRGEREPCRIGRNINFLAVGILKLPPDYLSTWGAPSLQTWASETLSNAFSPFMLTRECCWMVIVHPDRFRMMWPYINFGVPGKYTKITISHRI